MMHTDTEIEQAAQLMNAPGELDYTAPAPAPAPSETQPAAEPQENGSTEEVESESPQLSKSWAAISRKEAEIRRQRLEMDTKLKEFEQMSSEIEELKGIRKALEQDPLSILDKVAGPDWYEKATQRYLNDPSGKPSVEDEVSRLKSELAKERDERETWFDKKWQERQQAAEAEMNGRREAEQYVSQVKSLTEKDDRFELTRVAPGGIDAVLEVTNGYLQKYGKLLSPEEALEMVEEELTQQAEQLSKTSKLRSRFSELLQQKEASEDDDVPTQTANQAPSGRVNTLSNNLSVHGTPSAPTSREQELREAAKLYRRLLESQSV